MFICDIRVQKQNENTDIPHVGIELITLKIDLGY